MIIGTPENKSSVQYSRIDPGKFFCIPDYLPIKSFNFADSKNFYSLQVSDLLSGMMNEIVINMFNSKVEDKNIYNRVFNVVKDEDFLYMIPTIEDAIEDDRAYIIDKNIKYLI